MREDPQSDARVGWRSQCWSKCYARTVFCIVNVMREVMREVMRDGEMLCATLCATFGARANVMHAQFLRALSYARGYARGPSRLCAKTPSAPYPLLHVRAARISKKITCIMICRACLVSVAPLMTDFEGRLQRLPRVRPNRAFNSKAWVSL